ncbi:acyl-CoA dehydratase activase [Vagococcus fessus]|uniref:ATPase BadF/BadG/BcrA/BcrD type domain-containing protein n=1 Tax=Vagococcus fessus TaxID=120370 RepID=A0A430A6A9_9ENTE|nr:acyl-CoA dehydratase activase [Vagococcus fessus]RSU02405.1 hypothetical protein CBF31_08535 [Vagococcus fessus]
MYIIGIDSGSTTTKGVLYDGETICHQLLVPTAGDPHHAMTTIKNGLLGVLPQGDTDGLPIITTGYGRKLLEEATCITEISCHAAGVHYLLPSATQLIDIGGQDCKTISLNPKGGVSDFNMNDKCAAGTGRFVEVLMRTLGEDIENLDAFVKGATPVKINSMCTVFAESEVISLVAQGENRSAIAKGVLTSIVQRISNQLVKLGYKRDQPVFLSGGLAQSDEIRAILSDHLDTEVVTDPLAQYAGAIGAARLGYKKLNT